MLKKEKRPDLEAEILLMKATLVWLQNQIDALKDSARKGKQ